MKKKPCGKYTSFQKSLEKNVFKHKIATNTPNILKGCGKKDGGRTTNFQKTA
jgi:hypothetical protein